MVEVLMIAGLAPKPLILRDEMAQQFAISVVACNILRPVFRPVFCLGLEIKTAAQSGQILTQYGTD